MGSVVDKRPLTTFLTRDLLPFIAGAQAGVGSIMMSHNIVECMDKDVPASLSPDVHKTLRNLGFEGVIVTDGLAMKAITRKYSTREAAVLAVQSGNDMLMLNDYSTGIDGVLDAVKDGRITEERLANPSAASWNGRFNWVSYSNQMKRRAPIRGAPNVFGIRSIYRTSFSARPSGAWSFSARPTRALGNRAPGSAWPGRPRPAPASPLWRFGSGRWPPTCQWRFSP